MSNKLNYHKTDQIQINIQTYNSVLTEFAQHYSLLLPHLVLCYFKKRQ